MIRFQPTRPLRGATLCLRLLLISSRFQPTRPLRGATCSPAIRSTYVLHFNPRAPCGARLQVDPAAVKEIKFQPTRPLRGATVLVSCRLVCLNNFNPRAPCGARLARYLVMVNKAGFQPTRPLRGATVDEDFETERRDISTHAPLAGRDPNAITPFATRFYFNPRAPCGARRAS